MRTSSETSSIIEVVIEELSVVDAEVLRSRRDYSMWGGIVELFLAVFGAAYYHAADNHCVTIYDVLSEGEFNASEDIICRLEVVELHCTDTLRNRSIPPVLVRG